MAKPPNGTPGLPEADYVDMPGVTPITPQSFTPGSPANPIQLPDQIIGPEPDNRLAQWQALQDKKKAIVPITLPEQQITGDIKKPAPPAPGMMPTPGGPPGSFATSPLNPQQGLQADAQVFADIADNHRKTGDAIAAGKYDEAARHDQFAREQELSIGQSNKDWAAAQSDQVRREKAMDLAIAKGKAMSIDPDNYWNRKGTAANILSAISVGLGAFGSGMTKGATGNPALTLVNNAIEHDIQSQKENIENYWKGIQQQGHMDDTAFNRSLVTQNLQANMRLAGYKVYESDLKTIQAKTDSQVVKLGAQKQIDDLQLAMNAQRKQLGANLAAQAAAASAQVNKDADSFNKDTLDYMEKHPGMSPQDAARDVAAINPSRTARLGSRSALPVAAQDDFVYGKEKGFAAAFNSSLNVVADHNIREYEKKTGHVASDEDKKNIKGQTAALLLKQHPEFGQFKFYKPTVEGGLIDVRPTETPVGAGAGGQGGPDRRSKEQIAKDQERTVYLDQPVLGPDGQPKMGADGKPVMQKVTQLAVTKEAADRYNKWSNLAPTIKNQMSELKAAWKAGDVAKYEALRGAIIEKLPAMYGFERGPSSAQVEHTFKDLIPSYEHWYSPSLSASFVGQGRENYMDQKLDQATKELDSLGTDMRTNTFGPQAGAGRSVDSYGQSATPSGQAVGAPPAGQGVVRPPVVGQDYTVTMKGLPAGSPPVLIRTWVDNRKYSDTKGKALNVLRTSAGPVLEDPNTGRQYPIDLSMQDMINAEPDARKYDFKPRK